MSPKQIEMPKKLISAGVPCFALGTLISTERGEIPVEALKVGDRDLLANPHLNRC